MVLCQIDLTAAHQPASIVSTAKFGSTGQLASARCPLPFPEAVRSILSSGRELVEVQFAALAGRTYLIFLSIDAF